MTKLDQPDRLRFSLFTSFCPGGPPGALWNHPQAVGFDYLKLDDWVTLSQKLEQAKFDAIFWADHIGVYDTYQKSWATSVREAVQFPIADPLLLTAALAGSTRELGFTFSANIIQDHPYTFARKLTTLDHLTGGRIGWNIVTAFQRSAWRNMGHDDVGEHKLRYERAEEFVTVLYKLLEGSWEDDAVIRDLERRVYADPKKVHDINHEGKYYRVPGIHQNEPSPQRVPVLFQAGTSEDGRQFATRNAEAIFFWPQNVQGARAVVDNMTARLNSSGRSPGDMHYFIHTNFVVGSTEAEARRKDEEALEYLSSETNLAFMSGTMGADLAEIELDSPVGDFDTNAVQGVAKALAEAAPDKSWTFREVVVALTRNRIVGGPESIADQLTEWRDAGVTGVNVGSITGAWDINDFADYVAPVLQERGLMQKEYAAGTLREKMFAGTASASGPRLNERHPAASFRQHR